MEWKKSGSTPVVRFRLNTIRFHADRLPAQPVRELRGRCSHHVRIWHHRMPPGASSAVSVWKAICRKVKPISVKVKRGVDKYDKTSFMIRSRLYKGLKNGNMHVRSFFDDERYKLKNGACCVYCGSLTNISVDHMLSKAHGGSDCSDNLVCCCRHCNSSKCDSDLMEWYNARNDFPPLLVLRRYLKLVYQFCISENMMGCSIEMSDDSEWPFKLKNIPTDFPSPDRLKL